MAPLLLSLVLAALPPDAGALQPSMRGALTAIVGLTPLIASPSAFRDPANAPRIRAALDVLSQLEHFFSKPQGATDSAIATLFARQVSRGRTEFDAKDTEAARFRLRAVTSMCFGCHVRTPTDHDVAAAAPLVESLALPPLERAAFFATTRQFDRALSEWNQALAQAPKNDVEAFEQAEALRAALVVTIQGKDDPKATIALLEKHKDRAELPGFMTRQMARWLSEAKGWQTEKFDASRKAPSELVARATALLANSGIAKSPTPDENRLVSHLRAAGYLQEALRREPQGPFRGEALLLLGTVAAATTDPSLWRLEWIFLEACIREYPKSALARQCADRLSERTWQAYTSRAGLDVPGDVGVALGELNALAR
ncbi:MAG: hypothetical protein MUC96_22255 [Myxococcaceae bacterium]|jgi:hypothetical protein|nr:hypothetical protein [Myxococcaceae bacterium]